MQKHHKEKVKNGLSLCKKEIECSARDDGVSVDETCVIIYRTINGYTHESIASSDNSGIIYGSTQSIL